MLVRITGGNSGIKDYLEKGQKQDRHYSRDELDRREPIYGDLELTDSIINSIADKGQERYLHITMSFKEKNIETDKVKNAVTDFIKTSMAAYKADEFNYYAEIHHPRLKSIYNSETAGFDDRLTHVHIVLPKQNLISSGRLNPFGNYMQNVDFLEAIQEKINQDHGLESPRYNPRVTLHNKNDALGKYKQQLEASEKTPTAKQRAIETAKNATYQEFQDKLSEKGEVKVRNAGKDNEYLAVKFEGEKKFTNLREPVFRKSFLDDGKLEFEKLSPKVINERVTDWKERRSKEIKYIHDASKPVRNAYKALQGVDKTAFLNNREDHFYARHKTIEGVSEDERYSLTGKGNNKPSHFRTRGTFKPPGSRRVHSVQSLHERTLVHQQGRTLLLLQGDARSHVHAGGEQTDNAARLRRSTHGADGGLSSAIQHLAAETVKRTPDPGDLNKVAPERLLDYCQKTYLIDPKEHKITQNKNGDYRISSGARNLSNTDFLTKHIGLDWPQAQKVLTTLYHDQQNQKPIEPITQDKLKQEWHDFTSNINTKQHDVRFLEKRINRDYKNQRKQTLEDYRLERMNIKTIKLNYPQKVYLESLAIYNKMVKLETLKEEHSNSIREARNSIRPFYKELTNEGDDMKHMEKLKKAFKAKNDAWAEDKNNFENEVNAIQPMGADKNLAPSDAVKRAQKSAKEAVKSEGLSKIKMQDLTPLQTENGTDFKLKTTQKTLFRDTGKHLSFPSRGNERSNIEVGLDYAINRYGTNLDIRGTKEFKASIVEIAAEKNLDITFSDKKMNQQLADKKAEMGITNSQNQVSQGADSQTYTPSKGATPRAETKTPGTAGVEATAESKEATNHNKNHIEKKLEAAFMAGKAYDLTDDIASDRKQLEAFHSAAKEQLSQDKQMLDRANVDPEYRDQLQQTRDLDTAELQAGVEEGQKAVDTAEQRLEYMDIREQKQMDAQRKIADAERENLNAASERREVELGYQVNKKQVSNELSDLQHEAMGDGYNIKPLAKEHSDSPNLIAAYVHGLKDAQSDAQQGIAISSDTSRDYGEPQESEAVAAKEIERLEKNIAAADKYMDDAKSRLAELGYKITGDNLHTGYEKLDAGNENELSDTNKQTATKTASKSQDQDFGME
ncbi:LPD7 domain-containing protein [Halomonas sp. 3D7M]|uniref:LPD7 domain-containing protein n=1 Tax=Halomonas sp. 3D7M TaxID=2742617 RepID=UPI0018671FF1|nr:LPD7 domain-containing protein [Halomonas sp. 3D7M]